MTFLAGLAVMVGKVLRRLSAASFRFARRHANSEDSALRQIIRSTKYDMAGAPDESYFLRQYLNVLAPYFDSLPKAANVVDLGCGQGRMLKALQEHLPSAHLSGCDVSLQALREAQQALGIDTSQGSTLKNVDAWTFLRDCDDESIDLGLYMEVAIFMEDWPQVLKLLDRKMATGGLVLASFRPLYFNGLLCIRDRNFQFLSTIQSNRSGLLDPSTSLRFSWSTSSEVRDFFRSETDLRPLSTQGIGVASGIPGDIHADISRPSTLDDSERHELMTFEMNVGKMLPDAGRYFAVVCQKQPSESKESLRG